MSDRVTELCERIDRLERSARRGRVLLLGLLLLGIAGLAPSDSGVSELVRAKRLELVDESGVVRIAMGARIEALDGIELARFGVRIFDEAGVQRGEWSTCADGTSRFALQANDDRLVRFNPNVELIARADGNSFIKMNRPSGRPSWRLLTGGEGGALEFFDPKRTEGKFAVRTLDFEGERTTEYVVRGNDGASPPD